MTDTPMTNAPRSVTEPIMTDTKGTPNLHDHEKCKACYQTSAALATAQAELAECKAKRERAISSNQIAVSAHALREVLMALNGPGHYIRELQATRGLPGSDINSIDKLIEEYNEAARGKS